MQLLKGTARLDTLMLARVANQQRPILMSKPGKKLSHLAGACQARFIYEIEVLLCHAVAGICRPAEKTLQGGRFDSRFAELLGRAGCGAKPSTA